ncbi:LuxR family transcriptional regulator [Actinoplanes sp. OR16]|uniref:ATP-binding protein n=1 Tax=Actinoplanes sp. OR16 TaxID=946334 RepID=UPI000F6B853C|nr:LuxR family transcriptional regulator [Actinoplanes sp. OR16]BBH69836.1 LuxR family transcriptional regulator [Actinoplanes sp. OR16]
MGDELVGRQRERDVLDGLLQAVRSGQSRALVLRGEAGTGKTSLLGHLAGRAGFARVLRVSGIESESEIAYSVLQQLCAPLLGGLDAVASLHALDALAEPQRAALATAFGLASGPPPETLVLGLGVLGLFGEATRRQPLVCIVDDAQWVDDASALILGFVARRLSAESVALVFAVRDSPVLSGLPEMAVEGLAYADARALLDSVLTGPVASHIRDRIVSETRGNPLALRELPRGLSPAELAFGFAGASTAPLDSRMEQGFQRRIAALPAEARTVLLVAAVEPVGNPQLLWRALERLGLGPADAAPAESDDLIEFGAQVRFRHPLVRSAAWRSGTGPDLRAVHAALAAVTDPETDPDRRAWHRAHASLGPDATVAAELERSAGRALARGGWSAAAAFLERAASLDPDPVRRGELLVSAASARADAGAYGSVPDLLAAAEMGPLKPLAQATVESLRARVAFRLHHGRAAGPPLLAAARRLQTLSPAAARDTFLMAVGAAMYAGRFGADDLRVAAEAARGSLVATSTTFPDLLLAALVSWVLDGRAAAAPAMNRALDAISDDGDLGHVWLAAAVAYEMFRVDLAYRITAQSIRVARESGALQLLTDALSIRSNSLIDAARFSEAEDLLTEADAVSSATGATVYQLSRLHLAGYAGPAPEVRALFDAKVQDAVDRGDGRLYTLATRSRAVLGNGLGEYPAAVEAARDTYAHGELALATWALRELVEAAAYAGDAVAAAEARDLLRERTSVTPTGTARGLQALADALAGASVAAHGATPSPGSGIEECFRSAIGLLSVPETAVQGYRARLLFGEWLRRQNRRAEARVELRAAHEALSTIGARFLAARAERELAATGESVPKRAGGGRVELTAQEQAITQLAARGHTNPEIAAALFLSPRTVEWHLRKIFAKLGITSRRELAAAIRDRS